MFQLPPLQIGNITHPGTSCKAAAPNLRVIDFGLFHRVRRALRDVHSAFSFVFGPRDVIKRKPGRSRSSV